jgi:hypothetical protein
MKSSKTNNNIKNKKFQWNRQRKKLLNKKKKIKNFHEIVKYKNY